GTACSTSRGGAARPEHGGPAGAPPRPTPRASGTTACDAASSPSHRGGLHQAPMTLSLELGLALALACACITNLGSLYKHRGAQHAHAVDIRRPLRTARSLLASKWFAIGLAIATGPGVLHIAAMSLAPLSVVQAVLAAGVVLLGVTGERRFALRVTRRQAWG